MKTSKKILSVILSALLVFSTFSIIAFAKNPYNYLQPEGNSDFDYKFSVEKVDKVPENSETGSEEYVGEDIYAVSLYAKSSKPICHVMAPIHFNSEHFAPIMLVAEGDVYTGADGIDLYEGSSYYEFWGGDASGSAHLADGDYMQNTQMYRANGSTTTNKALAACIGLGNVANRTAIVSYFEYVGQDHPNYAVWHNGLDEVSPYGDKTGVVFFDLDDSSMAKNAYLNCVTGMELYTDWCKMGTVFFQRNPGVTDEQCIGDKFGVLAPDVQGIDGTTDGSGLAYMSMATVQVLVPTFNVVENAEVTAAAGPKVDKASTAGAQVKFTTNSPMENGVDDEFKLRIKSEITAEDWDTYFANSGKADATTNAITSVGIVAYQGTTGFSLEDAKSVADGMYVKNYSAAETDYVQKTDESSAAYFGAIIKLKHTTCTFDITYVGYVNYLDENGEAKTIFYNATEESYVAGVSTNYQKAVEAFLK